MNDRVLDLAADPAIRADRYRTPDVRPKELGLGADVAWALHPREWLDPDVGSDHDGAIRGVENGVGVDPRCLVDTKQVGRPHQGKGRQLTVGHPVLHVFLSSLIVHIPHRRRQIVDVSDPFNIDCR